jgi:hypothetical protein
MQEKRTYKIEKIDFNKKREAAEALTDYTVGYNYGQHQNLPFNPAVDKLDFVWFQTNEFSVSEVAGSVVITINNNGGQTYTSSCRK